MIRSDATIVKFEKKFQIKKNIVHISSHYFRFARCWQYSCERK